jgi:hypothetical protein
VQGAVVVGAWTPNVSRRWEEGVDEVPLPISKVNPGHAARLIHPTSVSEPPVVPSAQSSARLTAGVCS